MSDLTLLKTSAQVWADGDVSFERNVQIRIQHSSGDKSGKLFFELEDKDGNPRSAEFELKTDDGIRFEVTRPGTLKTCLGFAPGGGSVLSKVILERSAPPFDQNAPAWSILFYWDVTATATNTTGGDPSKTFDGSEIKGAATIRVFAGIGIVHPELPLGTSDLLVRLGIETFMLDTGWMPLPSIGGFNLSGDPEKDEENDGFWSPWEMPNLLQWFEAIVGAGEDLLNKLPKYRWDRELPINLTLPLGLRFKEQRFSISGNPQDGWHIDADLRGLTALWDGQTLGEWDDFAVGLSYSSADETYTFFAHFASETYPKSYPAEPYKFSLPFDLLKLEAECWRLKLGLFGTGGNGTAAPFTFCFDGVLEVGGLKITSGLFSETPVYETDLRLHLRDLSVMTAEDKGLKLFEGETSAPFTGYQLEVPQMTFARKLKDPPPPGAPNESGLTILDGDYTAGERFLIAWEQKGNQLIKALASDILGTAPAGKVPDGAKAYRAALEVAWFADGPDGRTTQLRFDWQAEKPPDNTERIAVKDPDILPVKDVAFDGASIGPGRFGLDFPGVSIGVVKPEIHSLVYRRGLDGDAASYLFLWPENAPVLTDDANTSRPLANISVGMSLRAEGGQRQVQDSDPFLSLAIGVKMDPKPFAFRVAGWKSGQGPQFFRVAEQGVPAIIPESYKTAGPKECPPRPLPRPAPTDLAYEAFQSIKLDLDGPWRLMIAQAADKAISKLFGEAVTFTITDIRHDKGDVLIETALAIALSKGANINGEVNFRFDLDDLSLRIDGETGLGLAVAVIEPPPDWAENLPLEDGKDKYKYTKTSIELLKGLKLDGIFKKDTTTGTTADLFTLDMTEGRMVLKAPENVDLILHNNDLNDRLTFLVTELEIGPAGIDVAASMVATTLKLPGLKTPFLLEEAALRIVGGRLQDVSIKGSGRMPALLNEAPFSFEMRLTQVGDVVRIADFEVSLGDGKAPIFSRGIRFRFDLTKVTIGMNDAGGTAQQAWHFLITGSIQFVPEGGEFLGNVLEDFQSITMDFQDAPLSDEFFEHIELIATLTEPKVFPLFALFEMEVRSIGFHPAFGPFGGKPAIIIGGQAKFADTGDVLSAKVDFHRMYIGFPKPGEFLPQFHFQGIRVEIASGGFKIAGELRHYDTEVLKGFAGSGTVLIPGMPELTASFAFTKLRAEESDSWKRGWFIAVEAAKISYQIGPLPIYLRQVGLGFGYRYTSVIIKRFEVEDRLGPLVELMKREINNHQTLADIDTWAPDAERAGERGRWSIGLEAVFSMASANSAPFKYNAAEEKKLQSIVAQLLIFLRSDLTFLAATKVWFPVSADDFFENRSDMRQRPLGIGFMLYSAPKNRLLIHVAKGKNPYLGPPGKPVPEQVKKVLDQSHFEATFLSEPGLVHAELGWPDRLFFKFDMGLLTLECRGGVLFRVERGVLVQGIYFSATGKTELGGGLSLGIVGVRVSANITVTLAMRLMIGIQLAKPLDSKIYAVVGFSVTIQFTIHAWFRLNLRFVKIKIDIYFRIDLQVVLVLEVGWAGQGDLGFRGRATLIVSAFGRSLQVKVSVAVGADGVNEARNAMKPYMKSYLDEGGIPPIPGLTQESSLSSIERREAVAVERTMAARGMKRSETRVILRSMHLDFSEVADEPLTMAAAVALAKKDESPSEPLDFRLALARGQSDAAGKMRLWFGWIMPSPQTTAFYPVPNKLDGETRYAELKVPDDGSKVFVTKKTENGFIWELANSSAAIGLFCHPHLTFSLENEDGSASETSLSLGTQLAACYLPAKAARYGSETAPFPGNYDGSFLLRAPGKKIVQRLRDDRLDTPGSEAENPRRQLEEGRHDYDDALLAAAEERELDDLGDAFGAGASRDDMRKAQLSDQAEGTQSYLARSFADDLKRLADTTRLVDGAPDTPGWTPGRPILPDTGMVVCVVAKECPDWLMSPRVDENKRATLQFLDTKDLYTRDKRDQDANWKVPQDLLPVIDFEKIDFELSPPSLLGKPRSYMDDDSLHFGWDIDWGPRGRPLDEKGDPANFELEDFIAAYEVVVTQDISSRHEPVDTVMVGPADIRAGSGFDEKGNPKVKRLKVTYQYNRQLSEIGIDPSRFFSTKLSLTARITPISQDGTYGAPFFIAVTHTPSRRPLPPDHARLELRLEEKSDKRAFAGMLNWRELVLPSSALVAETTRWDFVLRPLAALPPGAYPAEATDDDDAPLSGRSAVQPRDGDLIVTLKATPLDPNKDENGKEEGRDPARARYAETLPMEKPGDRIGGVYDHAGKPIPAKDTRYKRVLAMLKGEPANGKDGAAWHLFLRASADATPKKGETLIANAVSTMVRVRISLGKSEDGPGVRPLQHLEWVRDQTKEPLHQVAGGNITSVQGPIHLAAPSNNPQQLDFLPLPGTERGVTLWWNASSADAGVLDVASYHLFETRLDTLLNVDVVGPGKIPRGFGPFWQKLREVRPVSPADAGRVVSDFATPETWERLPPVKAATIRMLDQQGVPAEKMLDAWSSWYSWSDSELAWVDAQSDFETDLETVLERSEKAPQQVPDYGEGAPGSDEGKLARLVLALGAQHALGRYYSRRRLHPWMQIVVGRLTLAGASVDGTLGRFEVEVSQPKAPPTGDKTAKPDPVLWMQSDNAEADPTGWGALGQLGLAAGISLRDPWTGTYLLQSVVRQELEDAIKETNRRLGWLVETIKAGKRVVLADYLSKRIEDPAKQDKERKPRPHILLAGADLIPDVRHLGLDLPIQANWAERAQAGQTGMNDERMLSMVQFSLRPVATAMKGRQLGDLPMPADAHYAVLRLKTVPVSGKKLSDISVAEGTTLRDVVRTLGDTTQPAIWQLDGLNFGTTGEGAPRVMQLPKDKETGKAADLKLCTWLGKCGDIVILRHRNRSNTPIEPLLHQLFGSAYTTGGKIVDGALYNEGIELELLHDLYSAPLALSKVAANERRFGPWGKFAPDIDWMHYFFVPDPELPGSYLTADAAHEQFGRFMDHVTAMFAGWGDDEGIPADTIRDAAYEKATELVAAYLAWGERFFTAGPARPRDAETGWFNETIPHTAITTAWPQREAPMRSTPDARGRFQVTHRIAEDWASERAYAVIRVRRWQELFEPGADLPVPKLSERDGRTDIAFSRRRAVRPANMLGARVVLSEKGQPFHEVTLSEPSDLVLSKSSNALARKIEFEAVMRQFRLEFRYEDWKTALGVDVGYTSAAGEGGKFIDVAPDISVEAAAGDYLGSAPFARLGAIRIQTPSEPHYYAQEMRHYVAAAHVRSEVARILLPPPPATAPRAAKASETVTHLEVAWKDLGKDELDETKAEFTEVLPDELKRLGGYLAPQAHKLTIRAPRLFETLPEASLAGYHRHETKEGGYGQLPDPEARLEIVDVAGETRRTVATLAVDHQKNESTRVPLAIVGEVAAPNKVALEVHDDPKEILSLGLRGTVTCWVELSEQTGDLAKADADFPAQIDKTDDPYAVGVFPKVEPMFGLLPLLLRLSEQGGRNNDHLHLSQNAPLAGPRWLFRPHLQPTEASVPGTQEDLAYALRVIVDLQRRRALAAAATALTAALAGKAKSKVDAARRLMKSVEEDRAAMFSRPLGEVADTNHLEKLLADAKAAEEKGVSLYSVLGDTIGRPTVADELKPEHRLLLVLRLTAEQEAEDIAKFFGQEFYIGTAFSGLISAFDAISDETARLAARSYRATEPQKPKVFAHHANIPAVEWRETT
jgi:hypothetical protein